jgi:cation transport ATPase
MKLPPFARHALRRAFGADLIAGIAIVTAVILGQYLAGAIVVLMLAGGEALENYALRTASSVLEALARRMPSIGHVKRHGVFQDIPLDTIAVGDELLVHPHEICPVDGEVLEGHGKMDEAYRHRDAVPAAHRHPRGDHRIDFPVRPSVDHRAQLAGA